jgi:valyl-tRNA synthetase
MSEAAQLYIGEDRFAVRKTIEKDLEASGNLVETRTTATALATRSVPTP